MIDPWVIPFRPGDSSLEVVAMSRYSKVSEFGSRNGHTLVGGIVARISGCGKQKEISNDDQIDHSKEVVADV